MDKVLLTALLEDQGRALFLAKQQPDGTFLYSLPTILVNAQDNPVEALANAVRAQTGIDAQITTIAFTGRYNLGSKKRKQYISAIAFRTSAKSYKATCPTKWLTMPPGKEFKLDRQTQWII